MLSLNFIMIFLHKDQCMMKVPFQGLLNHQALVITLNLLALKPHWLHNRMEHLLFYTFKKVLNGDSSMMLVNKNNDNLFCKCDQLGKSYKFYFNHKHVRGIYSLFLNIFRLVDISYCF